MDKETTGSIISVSKQWWIKINTKPVRAFGADGAIYPHIITVIYHVDGKEYTKKKWVRARSPLPSVGSQVDILYDENRPPKAKIFL